MSGVQEKESIMSVKYLSTILSLRSQFGITWQSLVMPNRDPWDRFFYQYMYLTIMYIKILLSINQVNTLRPFKNMFSQSFSQLVKEDVYFLSIAFSTNTGLLRVKWDTPNRQPGPICLNFFVAKHILISGL